MTRSTITIPGNLTVISCGKRMRRLKSLLTFAMAAILILLPLGCRRRSNVFVIALSDNVKTIDPIGSPSVDAASERVRTLMFNSLVKKDEKFDYVPELASNIQRSNDGLSFTFTLRDGVTFRPAIHFSGCQVHAGYGTRLDVCQGGQFLRRRWPNSKRIRQKYRSTGSTHARYPSE